MQTPDKLEHFEVLRHPDGTAWELGRGAMGVTYKARDTRLHCDVAVKVIHPLLNASTEAHDRFLREARAAAALRHPNIAAAQHLGQIPDGSWFYVMEYCEGMTLQEAVAAAGVFTPVRAVEMASQIARALLAAEARGIVHRDLKPSNLILGERPGEGLVVKVIDFGLARALDDAGGLNSASLTTQGTGFLGTVQFASPEQLEERVVDIRSDFYSLGACLWYALTGQPVFRGPLARVMAQTLSAEPDWTLLGNVPAPVLALLKLLLAKDPASRPHNGEALLSQCSLCLKAISADAPPPPSPKAVAPPPSADLPIPAGNSLYEGETLLERYRVQKEPSRHLLGTDAILMDIEEPDEPLLRGLFIDATVLAAPPVLKRLQTLVTGLHEHPHDSLSSIVTWAEFGADWLIVMERHEGCKLLDVLKARSALPLKEALDWLMPVALGMDHALQNGLGLLEAGLGSITIHLEDAPKEDLRHYLQRPMAQWPRHRVVIDAFAWEQNSAGLGTPSTMPTVATRQVTAKKGGADAPATPASMIAALLMELVGGTPPQGGHYTPLPRLSEEANALLRLAWLSGGTEPGAAKLIRQLKQGVAMEDDFSSSEKAPKPLKAVARKQPEHAPSAQPPPSKPPSPAAAKRILLWVPHTLAGVSVVAACVLFFSNGSSKKSVPLAIFPAESTPAPAPSPQPAPRPSAPPPVSTPPPPPQASARPEQAAAPAAQPAATPSPPAPSAIAQAAKEPPPAETPPAPEPAAKPGDDVPPYARGISSTDIDRSMPAAETAAKTPSPAALQERQVVIGGGAPSVADTAAPAAPAAPLSKRGREVAEFVVMMQELENAQELDIIMSHYADAVEYYDKGFLTRDLVRADKSSYFARWPRTQATVKNLQVRAISGDESFEASYTSDFLVFNAQGGWVRGMSVQKIIVSFSENAPLVTKESGELLTRVTGKAGENPPATLSHVPATKAPGTAPKKNSTPSGSGSSFRDAARRFDNL
ncbi:protein kinase domain-containing protein [Prosthecobacter sp.]|uniref:serine/threonine-protein kinase n=1 Tax=Prosthecobacter sp. TaxID=1965333 RepID=UPI003782EC44